MNKNVTIDHRGIWTRDIIYMSKYLYMLLSTIEEFEQHQERNSRERRHQVTIDHRGIWTRLALPVNQAEPGYYRP